MTKAELDFYTRMPQLLSSLVTEIKNLNEEIAELKNEVKELKDSKNQ